MSKTTKIELTPAENGFLLRITSPGDGAKMYVITDTGEIEGHLIAQLAAERIKK